MLPEYHGKQYQESYMLECKLKSGTSAGLYFINEYLKQNHAVMDTKCSKIDIARDTINRGLVTKESFGDMARILVNNP